jgi:SagB-type dehydrogenase family enzyme
MARDGLSAQAFNRISRDACQILGFFLDPHTREEAFAVGISNARVDEALEANLILEANSELAAAALQWETNNWSRAAFLVFSQMNLQYLEPHPEKAIQLRTLTEFRRRTIAEYQQRASYPARRSRRGSTITLSVPEKSDFDLDALVSRRSVRSFSREPISFACFSRVLYEATTNCRDAEDSKSTGDPYFILNSFYSWLTLYVVVQGVDEIERGSYWYDPIEHQLVEIKSDVNDDQIKASIQYQGWIRGGGFCVFVGAHWERYMWIYRHSRAYINLLIQVGEFGQELLQSAYTNSLGGWLTPAVNESAAGDLFDLDTSQEEILYFVKLGYPRT